MKQWFVGLISFGLIFVVSGCASVWQTYSGKPKDRSEIALFTIYQPAMYKTKEPVEVCGYITVFDGKHTLGENELEMLPGKHTYSWSNIVVDMQYSGSGSFIAEKNSVYLLACHAGKFGVIKMPFKFTDSNLDIRK